MFFQKKQKKEKAHPLEQKSPQIKMELEKNRFEFFFNLKNTLYDFERKFETAIFWKSFINVFSLVSIFFTIIVPIMVTYVFWNRLPYEVPFFFVQEILVRDTYPKESFYFFPVLIGFLELAVFFLSYKIYIFDRRLSKFLNISIIFISSLYFIFIWQIMVLLLV